MVNNVIKILLFHTDHHMTSIITGYCFYDFVVCHMKFLQNITFYALLKTVSQSYRCYNKFSFLGDLF